MDNKTYSVLKAADTGCLGTIELGQGKAELIRSNPWISDHPQGFQNGSAGGTNTGCILDCRPNFEIILSEKETVCQIDICLPNECTHYFVGEEGHSDHTSQEGNSFPKWPTLDLEGLHDEMPLEGLRDLLIGQTLKVFKAFAEPDLSLEFSLLVGKHLELCLGMLAPGESVRLFAARLVKVESLSRQAIVRDFGELEGPWVRDLESLVAVKPS